MGSKKIILGVIFSLLLGGFFFMHEAKAQVVSPYPYNYNYNYGADWLPWLLLLNNNNLNLNTNNRNLIDLFAISQLFPGYGYGYGYQGYGSMYPGTGYYGLYPGTGYYGLYPGLNYYGITGSTGTINQNTNQGTSTQGSTGQGSGSSGSQTTPSQGTGTSGTSTTVVPVPVPTTTGYGYGTNYMSGYNNLGTDWLAAALILNNNNGLFNNVNTNNNLGTDFTDLVVLSYLFNGGNYGTGLGTGIAGNNAWPWLFLLAENNNNNNTVDGTYTVVKGDTLSGIALRQLGNASLWPQIARLNGISSPFTIFPGEVLRLPNI